MKKYNLLFTYITHAFELKFWIILSFFLSGFSALGFELLWVRLISLFFGHTTFAISAVLAVFMSGLGIGSYAAAKFITKIKPQKLLTVYCLLQIGIAVFGFISKYAIYAANSLALKTGILQLAGQYQNIVWIIITFTILIIPTVLMGATLPVLTQFCTNQENKNSNAVALLYGFNTLGSVFGVLAYGFFLINLIGISKSILLSCVINFLSALIVIPLNYQSSQKHPLNGQYNNTPLNMNSIPVIILGLAGFAGMVCEITWTRAFVCLIGSSTYAYSIVLSAYLLGISAGSIFYGKNKRLFSAKINALVLVTSLTAVSILIFMPLFNYIPYLMLKTIPLIMQNSMLIFSFKFLLCFLIMFLPALFMGISFPLCVETACFDPKNTGQVTGICYASSTLGSIIGSIVTGFIWLPNLGTEKSIIAAILIYLIAASAAWIFLEKRKIIYTTLIGIIFLSVFFIPTWNPKIFSSGMFMYAKYYSFVKNYTEFLSLVNQDNLIYYKEGISSSIAVFENSWKERYLRTNGKTDASSASDMSTQLLLGYIPFLFHATIPHNALVIGLGSGTTLASLTAFDEIKSIDCIEIEPAVKDAAKFFTKINRNALEDSRVNLIFNDARHYLAFGNKKYDLITSEPSNPWIAGIANLYTIEAFELAKNKLNENGIFCQWLHSYSMSEHDFKMILATFAAVFPNTMLLNTAQMDYLLIGSPKPFSIDMTRIRNTFKNNLFFSNDLKTLNYNDPVIFMANTFVLDDKELRIYSKGSALHFDDKPTLEFSTPLSLENIDGSDIPDSLLKAKTTIFPEKITGFTPSEEELAVFYNMIGENAMHLKKLYLAEQYFNKAFELNKENPRTLVNIGRVYNILNKHLKAEETFTKAIKIKPDYALSYFHLGMLLTIQGMEDKGLKYLEQGLKITPGDPMGTLQAAAIYINQGRPKEAQKIILKALSMPVTNINLRRSLETELRKIS